MACVYYDNDGNSISSRDLVEKFLRENGQLEEASIYSTSNIEETIIKNSNYDRYVNSQFQTTYDFVTSEHPEFKKFSILNGKTRLAPEIILENRIAEYVRENINNVFDDKFEVTTKLKEYLKLAKDTLSKIDPDTEYDNETILPIVNDIMKTIEIEEATKELSADLHRIISLSVTGTSNLRSEINEVLNTYPMIFGELSEELRDL